ncbi:MAG: polysaccharide biosynthesis tyrosine autokinase [Bacteroidetes bacterium]|nr:polysaccharide biosynthesis tyrosine autokinase [Fibrella sp.]
MAAPTNYGYTPYQLYEADSTPNLRVLLTRYLRHWRWFALSLTLTMVGAYIYLKFQQPIYRVQASVLIKDEKKGISTDNILKEMDIFAPKQVVENEVEILKSHTLMDKVVGQLHLDAQYFHLSPLGEREIYDESPVQLIAEKPNPALYKDELQLTFANSNIVRINGVAYPVNKSVQTPFGQLRIVTRQAVSDTTAPVNVKALSRADATGIYLAKLKVDVTSKSSTVVVLSLEEAVPAKGEAILNKLVEEYNQAAIVDKNKVAANTLRFIEDRLQLIAGELSTVEKDVELYKSTKGITDLSTQSQVFLENVKENDGQLNQVNIQLGALKDIERYVTSKGQEAGLTPATTGLNDPILLGLLTKVSELELQRDQLARTTSEKNPLLQSITGQIQVTKANINDNIRTMKQMLTGTRKQVLNTNRKLEGMIRTIPSKERGLLNISRQQVIKSNLYTYLLEKREETALSYASAVPDSRVVDEARTGPQPVKPVRNMIFLLFGLFGLLLPVGAIAARDALNDRVVGRSDVEDATHTPILGEVVESKNPGAMVMVTRNRSVISEQIRSLRTNLQFLKSGDTTSQVVLFTSSISGEGKSFLSMNLGASLAIVDRRTVILEMDLRKPKLHSSLGMANTLGITNYLIREATIDDILQEVPGCPNYYLISSGPIPPNPSELLSSPRLEQLITELRERFAYVIIDSPPIGLVTDAQLIAPFADTTLYMVRHHHTPKTYLKMIDMLFRENRFQRLNVILNAVGQGESYYSSYGYNNYYEEEEKLASPRKRSLPG